MPTDRPTLLQLVGLLPSLEQRLNATYDVHKAPPPGPARDAFLAENAARFTGVVTSAAVGIDNAVLDRLPNVKVISSFGVGLDKLDAAHAAKRSIPIGYTPDVLNDCVADLAFGLLLDVARRLSHGDRYVRAGKWSAGDAPPPLGRQVSNARLGIVGLGRIGRTIAKRASGFDMEVRYHSRKPVEGVPYEHVPQLVDLATWSDFLVVITAGGAGTRHLVNEAVLDALGTKGYLINVSRGTVIDEQALLLALQSKRIAGAALDVFEREPHVPPDFFGLDNVVLVPHIASATVQTREAMAQRVLDNLEAFFAGKALPSQAPV